jgi:hypothetical protein
MAATAVTTVTHFMRATVATATLTVATATAMVTVITAATAAVTASILSAMAAVVVVAHRVHFNDEFSRLRSNPSRNMIKCRDWVFLFATIIIRAQ